MGFFDKIKQALTRTKQQFVERFDEIVTPGRRASTRSRPVDVETLDALEELLISADVGVAATERIVERRARAPGARASRCASWSRTRSARSCRRPTRRCRTGTRRTSC